MIALHYILILSIGAAAGWFAGQITRMGTQGLAADMLLGVVGAGLTALLIPEAIAWGRMPAMFLGAVVFATLFLMVVRVFKERRNLA